MSSVTTATAGARFNNNNNSHSSDESDEAVDKAVDKVEKLLSQSWKDWDVSSNDLKQVNQVIRDLSAPEKNEVISRLPDDVLNTWGNELDGALGGLSIDERKDLFTDLAQDLSAEQLVRLSNAFGSDHQPMLAEAVQTQADASTRTDFVEGVQRSAIANMETPDGLSAEQEELYLDLAQLGLDVVGIAEPTPFADGTNGIISLFRGDWLGAGLSALSIVPYVGDLAKLGKLGKWASTVTNVIEAAGKSEKFASVVRPVLSKIGTGIDSIPDAVFSKLPKSAQDALTSLKSKIDDFLTGKTSSGKPDGPEKPPEEKSNGAQRAEKYGSSWPTASLDDAVKKFAGDSPVVTFTDSGKKLYTNPETGIQIVEDVNGGYFRIQDTNISGRRSYLDLDGNIPNNKTLENGTQAGRSTAEYNAVTHFKTEN